MFRLLLRAQTVPGLPLTAPEEEPMLASTSTYLRDTGELMEIKDLIIDDRQRGSFRVHRPSMTSPELFQQERELIFNQC